MKLNNIKYNIIKKRNKSNKIKFKLNLNKLYKGDKIKNKQN